VLDAPVSYTIYSAFSFYGRRRGGSLSGPWLVAASRSLGHGLSATRQTLYRMEGGGELSARHVGRIKHYRLTAPALAVADAGLGKILDPIEREWDRHWTLVRFRPDHDRPDAREHLRELCSTEGFASTGPGEMIHPRDRTARLLAASRELGASDLLSIFRGRRLDDEGDRTFVERHWSLDDLAARYRRFLDRYLPLRPAQMGAEPADAFVLRFALVFDYLEVAWTDPDLPAELLPSDWPGHQARALAAQLYRRFLPGAIRFADSLSRGRTP
jgi:phenylacetic acid degradation operon negative regulatory protein